MKFDSLLNSKQAEAVNHIFGPLLIVAGAGSGKTRVLTYRLANIISGNHCEPHEILAMTFTNKAAQNMKDRVQEIIQSLDRPIFSQPWVSTFHSTCVKILRQEIFKLGYENGFVIYDSDDQTVVVKKILGLLNLDEKKLNPKAVISILDKAKHQINPLKYLDTYNDEKMIEIYELYQETLKKSNALDFNDLLLKTFELFSTNEETLKHYQNRFKFIMVDEYQDTNQIQYLLIKLLGSAHQNVCVVGDEDQSIYSWRGADITNILNFENDFTNAKIIKLEENYRSTQTIVKAASGLIQNNTQRKDKTLFTSKATGELITCYELGTEYDESRFVVDQISQIASKKDINYSEFAVFYRTNAQSRLLEEQLRSRGIPYKIFGAFKFYERSEIKDVLSYLKLIVNPQDDVSFKRVINKPSRKIGKISLTALEAFATENKLNLYEASKLINQSSILSDKVTRSIMDFSGLIDHFKLESDQLSLTDLFQYVLEKTNYIKMLKEDDSFEAEARIQNIEAFYNAIEQFQKENAESNLYNFLSEMALLSDLDQKEESDNYVTLMTLHLSKGLEFNNVFIVGMEEGLFPTQKAVHSEYYGDVEEERRLAYVGMTRAMEKLFLTHVRQRTLWGTPQFYPPSRFLDEIQKEYMFRQTTIPRPKNNYNSENSPSYSQNTFYGNQKNSQKEILRDEDFSQSSPSDEIAKGARVRHPTYGVGVVLNCEGHGETMKVSVKFGSYDVKKFVAKFARLELI